MARNTDLNKAKDVKKDEFYTQLTDIEKEMRYYRKHFAGKTVFCNCDDPFESNFFKYFALNFNRLKLKKRYHRRWWSGHAGCGCSFRIW